MREEFLISLALALRLTRLKEKIIGFLFPRRLSALHVVSALVKRKCGRISSCICFSYSKIYF